MNSNGSRVQLSLRVQKGYEYPCKVNILKLFPCAWCTFEASKALVFSFPRNVNWRHVTSKLYSIKEVLEVHAYLTQIEIANGPLLSLINDHFKENSYEIVRSWGEAIRIWKDLCNSRSNEDKVEEKSLVVRCSGRKDKSLYTIGSMEIECELSDKLASILQWKKRLKNPFIQVQALLSSAIVLGILLSKNSVLVRPKKRSLSRSSSGLQEPHALVAEDTILEGLLDKLNGFSEDAVRAKAKELKVDTDQIFKILKGIDAETLIVDVRSPIEYQHGHIPTSVNIPLFTNEQRAAIGTLFNSSGRAEAIKLGLKYVVPRLKELVDCFKENLGKHKKSKIMMVCFRGGMRSSSVAWYIWRELGLDIRIAGGGYKGFKNHVATFWDSESLKESLPTVIVIGGRTGTGKTRVLEALSSIGKQVIDLEALANHKGSTFGRIPFELKGYIQPTNEMFLNILASAWLKLDLSRVVFVEDEGQHIGTVSIPKTFYKNILRNCSLVIKLVLPKDLRLKILKDDYASKELVEHPAYEENMINAVLKAKRKLGPERTEIAIDRIRKGQYENFASIMLTYYDDLYDKHIASAGGTGIGKGSRSCKIVPIEITSSLFDESRITGSIVEKLEARGFKL